MLTTFKGKLLEFGATFFMGFALPGSFAALIFSSYLWHPLIKLEKHEIKVEITFIVLARPFDFFRP
jgi:hypothetical protein